MEKEYSAGIIIYKKEQIGNKQELAFLLLKNTKGHWDFPKGIIELGEKTIEAALREVKEETGLTDIILDSKFKHDYHYFYKDLSNDMIDKTVTLFLGKLNPSKQNDLIKLSDEHTDYKWLTINDALNLVSFDNAKNVLNLAKLYLIS